VIAIETASDKNWRKLWLETDSKLVVLAFCFSYCGSLATNGKMEKLPEPYSIYGVYAHSHI